VRVGKLNSDLGGWGIVEGYENTGLLIGLVTEDIN
jgi:hypothetical protein